MFGITLVGMCFMNQIFEELKCINSDNFTYRNLEHLADLWQGKVCIRGAGALGKGVIYDILKTVGFHIDYFVDINVSSGTIIRDGVRAISIDGLENETCLFFIAVSEKYRKEIIEELSNNELFKYIIATEDWEKVIIKSVKESGDRNVINKYAYWADDKIYIERCFERRVGYTPDLEFPRTFNEKMQWLKLNDRKKWYTQLVDKCAVKQYVGNLIGEQYIIPTIGVWEKFEEIDFCKLPEQFVLKCTHDSGSSIVCKNKALFDTENAEKKLKKALKTNYYYEGREWTYKDVPPRILCEKYIGGELEQSEEILDYKIMCFNGVAKCSFVCSNRDIGLNVNFYDREWNPMPFWRHYPKRKEEFQKPSCYEEMIFLAEKISRHLPFARIDFYNLNGSLYFGEITLYPGNGMEEFHPMEWDIILGEWLDLQLVEEDGSAKSHT